jgi:nucleoside-diphosphate-sugar epimerase
MITVPPKNIIFITGAAGYVGAMLVDQFSLRSDVEKIVCLDKEPLPDLLQGNAKVVWIRQNMATPDWKERVAELHPNIVIHTAWQIREMYGKKDQQWQWNVDGSCEVFDFAFLTPGVKKLIHFSTASVYGAFPSNTLEHRFTEDEPRREKEYLYGLEKSIVEERLREQYESALKAGRPVPRVAVVRPAAITGPRGRYMRVRFGLQAALSGQLKGSLIHRVISLMVSFVPATKLWCRQFIHEDDVVDIVNLLAFGEHEIFNITPPGPPVLASDMAHAVGKKTLSVNPFFIRIAFFLFWHGTRGRVPTSRGGWKFYSYPIVMDGSKTTRILGYRYQHESKDAFVKKEGRYAKYIPQ